VLIDGKLGRSLPVRVVRAIVSWEDVMPVLRSRSDRMIAGVCGGLAKALGWSPLSVRILYVVVSVLSAAFPGILAYIILWVVMPEE
jgi:phage shock protein C